MANADKGHVDCPICGHPDAAVRESTGKAPKPYVMCDECGFQGFARGEKAVSALRTKMRPIAAAVEAIDTTPKPEAPAAPTPPTPPKKKSMWDDLGIKL